METAGSVRNDLSESEASPILGDTPSEVPQGGLDAGYAIVNTQDSNTDEAPPPPSFTMVIRGFIPTRPEEEVAELLEEDGIPVSNIKQVKKKDTTDQNKLIAMPLLVISVPMEQQDRLKTLSKIARVGVVTEPYRQDRKPHQCFKCQQFGHHSGSCGQEEKCVKYAGPHHSDDCPHEDKSIQIKCANCEGAHTASDRNCRHWQEKLNKTNIWSKNKNIHLTTAKNQQPIAPQLCASHFPELPPHYSNLMKQTEEKGLPLQGTNIEDPSPITETGTREAIKSLHTQEFQNAQVKKNYQRNIQENSTTSKSSNLWTTVKQTFRKYQIILNITNNLHKVNEVNELKILLWNPNGIRNKDYEFARFMLIEDIDIALITETRLNPTKRLSLPNYSICQTDRQDSTGGGTAIFIKNNTKHRPLE
ncbi:hypothetical protein PR048_002737 [Dryococelus australis]|uniref:Nucleic-acid-binding protein from transposon X-element n=1 Tax=Dryococelus australis TaxID=614101 RepID=A0ABQ9IL16_9NEOP|nr:hypothetical protein PR048_002737 [Dryococelus australis]